MNKLEYLKPNAEIIKFDNSDVITTSGTEDCPNNMKNVGSDWWQNRGGCFLINQLWGAPECTGEIHKAPGNGGKCWWVNGKYSLDDEEIW